MLRKEGDSTLRTSSTVFPLNLFFPSRNFLVACNWLVDAGLVVPDLPLEETGKLRELSTANGLELVSPTFDRYIPWTACVLHLYWWVYPINLQICRKLSDSEGCTCVEFI